MVYIDVHRLCYLLHVSVRPLNFSIVQVPTCTALQVVTEHQALVRLHAIRVFYALAALDQDIYNLFLQLRART
jgi:hypothetical protein